MKLFFMGVVCLALTAHTAVPKQEPEDPKHLSLLVFPFLEARWVGSKSLFSDRILEGSIEWQVNPPLGLAVVGSSIQNERSYHEIGTRYYSLGVQAHYYLPNDLLEPTSISEQRNIQMGAAIRWWNKASDRSLNERNNVLAVGPSIGCKAILPIGFTLGVQVQYYFPLLSETVGAPESGRWIPHGGDGFDGELWIGWSF